MSFSKEVLEMPKIKKPTVMLIDDLHIDENNQKITELIADEVVVETPVDIDKILERYVP